MFQIIYFFYDPLLQKALRSRFQVHPVLLQLVLPVGIFFTPFTVLSYVIDIYYKRIQAERNFY